MPRRATITAAAADLSDLSALTPDPRNARSHSERNLELIALSLQEVGAARSIVVDEDGVVLAGNATVTAAQQAGIGRVRVIDADGTELVAVRRANLTRGQKRRLALLDNRTAELATWDSEVLAALAEDTDLSGLWEPDELAGLLGEEFAPAPLLGDPDAVPDVPEVPITQPGDLWLLGPHRLRSHFMWQTEPCAYGWVEGNQPDHGRRPPPNTPNAWPVDSVGRDEAGDDQRVEHPTQKPVELFARTIAYHTKPGEVVYEPFAGSGSALVAAELAGRACCAMELEPAYCDVVVARWEALTGQQAERVAAANERVA